MELYQPLKNKRPHAHVADGFFLSSLPPQISLAGPVFGPLPTDSQHGPEQVTSSYASTSAFQIIPNIQPQYFQKRRKTNGSNPMTLDHASVSDPDCQKINLTPDAYTQHRYGGSLPMGCLSLVGGAVSSEALSSPLVRRMNLGMASSCPLCCFGWGQSNGYQQLPEAQLMYDPSKPYIAEKQPCMQLSHTDPLDPIITEPPHFVSLIDVQPNPPSVREITHSDSLGATITETVHPVSLSGDQSNPAPPANSPGYTAQDTFFPSVSPNRGHGDHLQDNTQLPDYYQGDPFVAEQHPQNELILPPDILVEHNPDLHFEQSAFGASGFPPVLQEAMLPTEDHSLYNVVPAGNIPNTLPPDGWEPAPAQQTSNFDILLPHQRSGKRGPFRDLHLREQTARTRKIGSCIRCRMQRIRCESDPGELAGCCLTCQKVTNTKAGRFPCLRLKITDIKLYKPGQVPGYEWSRRWNTNISDPIQKWASSDIKTVRISEGYSNRYLELRVREFVPQEGDKLSRTWDYNGMKKSVAIPPYALMDMDDVMVAYTRHIRDSMTETLENILGSSEGLLHKTYHMALQVWQDPSTSTEVFELLNSTLRLWTSIRLSTTSFFIVGDETLGMPADILDQTSPNPGRIPLPPVLGAQLDLILIHHIQTKLRREALDKLQKLTLKNKQSNWLVIYLVTFILLHNTALITAHDARYARKHGMKRRFAREDKVQEYHIGASILLAHFHYCNKGVHPFSDDCKDHDLKTLGELGSERIQFVHNTRNYAKQHRREWAQLLDRSAFEDDYFFVSQLFDENWQPRPTA